MVLTQFLRRRVPPVAREAIRTLRKQEISNNQIGRFYHYSLPSAAWNKSAQMARGGSCVPYRSSSGAPMSAFDVNLLRILESEIKYEMDSNTPTEISTEGIPFTVEDKPGQQWIALRRKYGNENIKVEATMIDTVAPDQGNDDADGDIPCQINLVVTISKGEATTPLMEICCSGFPDEIAIDGLAMKEWKTSHRLPYEGPDFQGMDENLQKAFHEFLEERGIDGDLSNFLHELMENKGTKEYLQWLKNVKSFIEK